MRFHLCSLSAEFSNRCVFGEFERISVDGRPKRIEMYAFSNENALVWTGNNSRYKNSAYMFHITKFILINFSISSSHPIPALLQSMSKCPFSLAALDKIPLKKIYQRNYLIAMKKKTKLTI